MKNYYRILGLDYSASDEEITAAYRIMAQRVHPDKGGSNQEFILIQEAYTILGNPLTRASYDRDLSHWLNSFPVTAALQKKPSSSLAIWVALLFAVGGVVFAGVSYYWQHQRAELKITNPLTTTIIAKPTEAPQLSSHNPAKKSSRKMAAINSSVPTKSTQLIRQGIYFVVNVGSFSALNDAKQQQAALTKIGYSAQIQEISANSEGLNSYNLFLGPYANGDKAATIQQELESQNLSATIEKVNYQ